MRIQLHDQIFCLATIACVLLGGCSTTESPNRQIGDIQITAQIKSKLASDVRLSSLTNIAVNTTNGVVTLSGQVENPEIRHAAESVAGSVPGVVKVNNEIQVQQGRPAAP
jgi:hyperosmotically inducible protein